MFKIRTGSRTRSTKYEIFLEYCGGATTKDGFIDINYVEVLRCTKLKETLINYFAFCETFNDSKFRAIVDESQNECS